MARSKGKPLRLERIRQVVDQGDIRSQHQLRAALRRMNVVVDQSTLSRDLAELAIHKIDGRYVIADVRERPEPSRDLSPVVLDWSPCGANLVVMHTAVGQAQSVAVAIDRADEPSIAGTLAGDDTIFIATGSTQKQRIVLRRLERWFGDKRGRQA